ERRSSSKVARAGSAAFSDWLPHIAAIAMRTHNTDDKPALSPPRRARMRAALMLSAAGLVLAGCGDSVTRTLGLVRDAPDEFTVTTRAPLAMPPSFELPPPQPGAPRPQERPERVQAEEALVPQTALGGGAPAPESPGQQAIVRSAG